MKRIILSATLLVATTLANAQERGNAAYEANAAAYGNYNYGYNNYNYYNQSNYNYPRNNNQYLPNDSVYTFGARVMINLQPDAYMAVFCVQQEALTVLECSKLITARIDKFKAGIKTLGITDENVFVDLIAQTRIYDFNVVGKTATETKQGFEFKKNIIIKFTDHNLLEKIMLLAAEQEIYDIVKVDYIINDIEKIQNQLRDAAMQTLDNKRKFALENSSLSLSDKGLIQFENFNLVYPQESYKQYTAAETGHVQPTYYSSNAWIKEQRKSKTFYFEKLNPALFDKVINPAMVQIPVQMTLDISVKYYIGKPAPKTRK